MATTANYNWPLPSPTGLQIAEMGKVANSLLAVDVKMKSVETALASHKHAFADLLTIPTTIAGYGITDAMTRDQVTDAILELRDELRAGAGAALDTFKELADALGNDPNFASTISTALGNRVRVDAANAFSQAQKAQGRSNLDALGTADKGVANGVASLDSTGKVYATQLPPMEYIPSAGGVATGPVTVSMDTNANINLQGGGNRLLQFKNAAGAITGLVWSAADGRISIRAYSGSTSYEVTMLNTGQFILPLAPTQPDSAARKDYVDGVVANRPIADSITHLGFASNNVDAPYMRRASDAGVYYLQRALGFVPARQRGGNVTALEWAGAAGAAYIDIDNGGYRAQIVDSNNISAWLSVNNVIRTSNTDVGTVCVCKGTGPIGSLGRGALIAGGSLVPVALADLGGSGNYATGTLAGTWRYWGPDYWDASSSSKIAGLFVRVS